jgi:3-deoxy-D-manno-octulosonic acid kinase
MKDIVVSNEGNNFIAYNRILFEEFPQCLFDPEYLEANSLLETTDNKLKHGRGGVYGFNYKGFELVLRHYNRGGIPAKIIKDKYMWVGFANSRAMLEMEMLQAMYKMGLPVPEPVAVHVHRELMVYQADIVTVLIPNSKTLSSILLEVEFSSEEWQKIGQIIKKFHNFNCNHVDLNAHNILRDAGGKFYLIDFDRSSIKDVSGKWKMKNLERLKRSLEKLASVHNGFNYTSLKFASIMQGYAE